MLPSSPLPPLRLAAPAPSGRIELGVERVLSAESIEMLLR